MSGLSFGQDAEGNWGYKPEGADAVVPFKQELIKQSVSVYGYSSTDGTMYSPEAYKFTAPKPGKASFYVTFGCGVNGPEYGCYIKMNDQEWLKIIAYPEDNPFCYGGWSDSVEISANDVVSIGIRSPKGAYSHIYSATMVIE